MSWTTLSRVAGKHASLHTTARCLQSQRLPPGDLNRLSRLITRPKDQGASQAMLYATPGIENDEDLTRAMVGVASVW